MQPRKRHTAPPWDRRSPHPRHPTGRARRRWPRAYDGGLPPERAVERRYRRAYDGDLRAQRRRQPRPGALDTLRQSPLRNGLIGLAVVGTAAPIAINRHQQALRTDASHENRLTHVIPFGEGSDEGVRDAWSTLESEAETAEAAREAAIAEKLDQYASFGLTQELAEAIYDAAVDFEIEPSVAFGLVRAESSFRNSSTSPVGAIGLTQLMPRTAEWLEPGVTRAQLRDPGTNLRIGFKYLRSMLDKYDGDEKLALLAYNRGPGTVDRELRNGRNPDNGYADFVHGKEGHGHTLFTAR
jgi:soluble lytic murein transglycosylase-like protein